MKKNIILVLLLVLLIVSVIGNIFLANKWSKNKNEVVELNTKVSELSTALEVEKGNIKTEVEEVVKTEVPYVNLEENSDKIAQRVIYADCSGLNTTAQYTKHVKDETQGNEILVYFSNDNRTLKIPVDKEVANMKFINYGNALDLAQLLVIFTDGTAKRTSYMALSRGETTLEDIDTESKKAVAIENVRKWVGNDVAILCGALVLEDGTIKIVD